MPSGPVRSAGRRHEHHVRHRRRPPGPDLPAGLPVPGHHDGHRPDGGPGGLPPAAGHRLCRRVRVRPGLRLRLLGRVLRRLHPVLLHRSTSGINACPPGTFAGGWWKADGSEYCSGPRYYIDCMGECHGCGCGGGGFCPGCDGLTCECALGTAPTATSVAQSSATGSVTRRSAAAGASRAAWCRVRRRGYWTRPAAPWPRPTTRRLTTSPRARTGLPPIRQRRSGSRQPGRNRLLGGRRRGRHAPYGAAKSYGSEAGMPWPAPWWEWRPRRPVTATGWWARTVGSSPSATPFPGVHGRHRPQSPSRRHGPDPYREGLLAGGVRRWDLHLR